MGVPPPGTESLDLAPERLPSLAQSQIQPFPFLGPRSFAGAEPFKVGVRDLGDPPEHAHRDRLTHLIARPLPLRDADQDGQERTSILAEMIAAKLDEALSDLAGGFVVHGLGHGWSPSGKLMKTKVASLTFHFMLG
jgi:hypothetical protein